MRGLAADTGAWARRSSSSSSRASAMSCRRRLGSLSKSAPQQDPDVRGRRRRQLRPVGFALEDSRQRLRRGLTAERAPAREHLVEHTPEGPDVAALIGRPSFRLLRRHVRRRAENHPGLRHRRRRDRRRLRGVCCRSARRRGGSIAFARPKSSTLTVPSARTLILAGFRSRWMMPCPCAASSASAICLAIGSASSSGIAPSRDAVRERRPLDQFHHERQGAARLLEAVNVRDVRVIERGEDFRFTLKPGEPIGVAGRPKRAGP